MARRGAPRLRGDGTAWPSSLLSPVPFEATTDDLRFALSACARGRERDRDRAISRIATLLGDPDVIVTASARAAFDLLLGALALPPGTAILFTPTIAAMPAIARAHRLVPVPVELDPLTLAPDLEALDRALAVGRHAGARPCVLVMAHLFGVRAEVTPATRLAHAHGVFVVEDRAQAFHDPKDPGNTEADAVIHSFGILKTASALGGAAMRVGDPILRAAITRSHAAWPEQSASTYARSVTLHLALSLLATREAHAAAIRASEKLSTDLDALALRLVCSPFRREQPSHALLAMLEYRLATFDPATIRARIAAVRRVAEVLPRSIVHIGGSIAAHAHWTLPIAAPRPETLVRALRAAGFHAATKAVALENGAGGPAGGLLQRLVYLPFASDIRDRELASMKAILCTHVGAGDEPGRRSVSRAVRRRMHEPSRVWEQAEVFERPIADAHE